VALGGDRRFTGTAELVFPLPIAEESKSTRLSLFVDAGNVWGYTEGNVRQKINWRDIRASYGASFIWITPVGALRFSWAWPLRSQPQDELQVFQFSIGAPF
jgi:outer membrane protein insertion porin family